MIIECCSQERSYSTFYGLIGERFCKLNRVWNECFEEAFANYYTTIHRYETNRLRNIAHFFGHLFATDSVSWTVLECIKLTEDDTTSSSRIFIKIMMQEVTESMGLKTAVERFKDEEVRMACRGMFPMDNPKDTRFAINYFTSIGLGAVTEEMREHLKVCPYILLRTMPLFTYFCRMRQRSSWSSVAQCSRRSLRLPTQILTRMTTVRPTLTLTLALLTHPTPTIPDAHPGDAVYSPRHAATVGGIRAHLHLHVGVRHPLLRLATATRGAQLHHRRATAKTTETCGWPTAIGTRIGTGRAATRRLPAAVQYLRLIRGLHRRGAGTTVRAVGRGRARHPGGTESTIGSHATTRGTEGIGMIPGIADRLIRGTDIGETRGGDVEGLYDTICTLYDLW